MIRHLSIAAALCIAPWLVSVAALRAQDEVDDMPMKTPAKLPAAKTPAAPKAPGNIPPAIDPLLKPVNPAVEAIIEAKPSTPSALLRAAVAMLNFNEPRQARAYLKQLLVAKPDDAALAKLSTEFGVPIFLRLAVSPEAQPEGKAVADAVSVAAEKHYRDAQRIESLIGQLQDPSPRVRTEALVELQHSARQAVGPLTALLADAKQAAAHAGVAQALIVLGEESVGPLTALLAAPDKETQLRAVRALAAIGHPSATPHLLPAAFGEGRDPAVRSAALEAIQLISGEPPRRDASIAELARAARERYDSSRGVSDAYSPSVVVWRWDEQSHVPVADTFSERDGAAVEAARLARAARELDPQDKRLQRLALGAALTADAYRAGLDKSLPVGPGTAHAAATAAGIDVVESLLSESLESGHTVTAAAAARILGQSKQPTLLVAHAPRPSPLSAALRHDDRRVRFAALEAVLTLRPAAPFPGSSGVSEALAYFAGAVARPKALVVDGNLQEAQRLAGLLIELGYDAEAVPDARALLRASAATSDLELVLIETLVALPASGELVQQLHRDPRTANVLVGIVASSANDEHARSLAGHNRLTAAIVRPVELAPVAKDDDITAPPAVSASSGGGMRPLPAEPKRLSAKDALQRQLAPLVAQRGRGHVAPAERQAQAAQALAWLVELTAKPQSLYDLRRAEDAVLSALQHPPHARTAAIVLAQLGTPRGQQSLVHLASQGNRPAELRQAAIAALRRGVARHGVLLTSAEIEQQYDLYNRDAGQDKLLGAVLDCLEIRGKVEG